MLLVQRSEWDWQLTKCPLQEVNMWRMCKYISSSEDDNIYVQLKTYYIIFWVLTKHYIIYKYDLLSYQLSANIIIIVKNKINY